MGSKWLEQKKYPALQEVKSPLGSALTQLEKGGKEMILFLEDIISLPVGFEKRKAPRLPTSFSSEAAAA